VPALRGSTGSPRPEPVEGRNGQPHRVAPTNFGETEPLRKPETKPKTLNADLRNPKLACLEVFLIFAYSNLFRISNFLQHFTALCPLLSAHRHLITLSALARTFGGIVRPICFAAFRLMISSNFVGCSTGKSAGFAPLRILSTYVAARRSKSLLSTP